MHIYTMQYYFLKVLLIYLRETDHEHSGRGRSRLLLSRELYVGLDPRTLGS